MMHAIGRIKNREAKIYKENGAKGYKKSVMNDKAVDAPTPTIPPSFTALPILAITAIVFIPLYKLR